MFNPQKDDIDLESSVEIADGIYWFGFFDEQAGLHCNPYLIIDNNEAVVIDGGSRPDFATVMMKILQTGIAPNQIIALLYQHGEFVIAFAITRDLALIRDRNTKAPSRRISAHHPDGAYRIFLCPSPLPSSHLL